MARSAAGDRITVSGMHNNASGVLEVEVDDGIPYMLNLWSNDVECGLFVDYYLANGSHTLKLTLRNLDAILHAINETDLSNEGTILNPVLHLTDITYALLFMPASPALTSARPCLRRYFVPGAFAESTPVPSAVGGVAAASSTSHKNIAAIVAGTVGGVVGLAALVLGVLFFLRKRAARKGTVRRIPAPRVSLTRVRPQRGTRSTRTRSSSPSSRRAPPRRPTPPPSSARTRRWTTTSRPSPSMSRPAGSPCPSCTTAPPACARGPGRPRLTGSRCLKSAVVGPHGADPVNSCASRSQVYLAAADHYSPSLLLTFLCYHIAFSVLI